MTAGQREKVFGRIRKLLSLSESPVQAEAEEAARKAHELLVKYNLSLQDVETGEQQVKEVCVLDGYRKKKWRVVLLIRVAEVNFCAMITGRFSGGYYRFVLVGKEHNIQTARWMGEYLLQAVQRISRREIPKNAKTTYRENYRLGMAMGISAKLEELCRLDEESPDSRALVVTEDCLVEEYLQNRGITKKQIKGARSSRAFEKGFVQGQRVPLNTQIR